MVFVLPAELSGGPCQQAPLCPAVGRAGGARSRRESLPVAQPLHPAQSRAQVISWNESRARSRAWPHPTAQSGLSRGHSGAWQRWASVDKSRTGGFADPGGQGSRRRSSWGKKEAHSPSGAAGPDSRGHPHLGPHLPSAPQTWALAAPAPCLGVDSNNGTCILWLLEDSIQWEPLKVTGGPRRVVPPQLEVPPVQLN